MPEARLAPTSALALMAGGVALAFTAGHPATLAALALGGGALLRLAGGRRARVLVAAGLASAIGLALLTPFVGAAGDLILVEGPALPVIDTQVTLEELLAGIVLGLRVLAVTLIVGATLALVDEDRLLGAAMRLAPRSAMTVALAARGLPSLERDAVAIVEGARARGASIGHGSWTRRARGAAPLVVPLLGASLERGLDVAEAMSARGYGAGPRTPHPEPALRGTEWALAAIGAALGGLALLVALTGAADYEVFPRAPSPLDPAALVVAGAVCTAMVAAVALVRSR